MLQIAMLLKLVFYGVLARAEFPEFSAERPQFLVSGPFATFDRHQLPVFDVAHTSVTLSRGRLGIPRWEGLPTTTQRHWDSDHHSAWLTWQLGLD